MLFVWSKGANQRRKILKEISRLETLKESVYVSKLKETLSKIDSDHNNISNNGGISISAIRKHIKVLHEYGFISSLNPGGKPEYIQLTETGHEALKKLRLNN